MSSFSMGEAWAAGRAAVTDNGPTIAIYTAMATIIPILVFSIFPETSTRTFLAMTLNNNVYYSDETPRTIAGLFVIASFAFGTILFGCWSAVLAASRDGLIIELMNGAVANLLSMIVATGVYVAMLVPVAIIVGVIFAASGGGNGPPTVLVQIVPTLMMIPMLWLNARLCLAGPAMVDSGSINPFAGLAQSWRLTAPCQWRVLFYLLIFQIISYAALIGIFAGATALILGSDGTSWHDYGVTAAWMVFLAMTFLTLIILPVGIYRTVRPQSRIDIFE